jgi:hypothetical protein
MWVLDLFKSKTFWIIIGLAGLVSGGWYVKGVFDDRAALRTALSAERAAKKTGGILQGKATQAEVNTMDRLRDEKEKGDARTKALEAALRKAQNNLASCRIDADTLLVLDDDAGSSPPDTPASNRPDPSAMAAGSTCEALALTFDENHKRFRSNLTQLLACQVFYSDVRERYCKDTKAC